MVVNSEDGHKSSATMVMIKHEDGGIFSYATPHKDIQGDAHRLPTRMAKDIENCGNQNVVVQIQSDQEPAIVNVQEEIRTLRKGRTICTNSPVGESESNGRAENAVKRVQAKFRALRSDLEERIGAKIDVNKPFGSWLVRWAGEVLTRYTRGDDGKTAWSSLRTLNLGPSTS